MPAAKLEKKDNKKKNTSPSSDDKKKPRKAHFKKKTSLRSQLSQIIRNSFSKADINLKLEAGTIDYLQVLAETIIADGILHMNNTKRKHIVGLGSTKVWIASRFPHIKTELIMKAEKTLKIWNSRAMIEKKKEDK